MADRAVAVAFAGAAEDAGLLPPPTPEAEQFERGLERGVVRLLRCAGCARFRLPWAPVCPHCHSSDAAWETAAGTGRVFSWVRYHREFVPEFAALVPYSVVCVELEEGVRVFGRYLDEGIPETGQRVYAAVEAWPEHRFALAFRKDPAE